MIELYALTSPNVQKVIIMLEELDLPYRVHVIDVWKGQQFTPEFGKINANRKVPVIVDPDGPSGKPYTVIESGAILMYLADKFGHFLPIETAARYEAIQWLMIQVASMGPNFGNCIHFTEFAPPGNDYGYSRFRTETRRLYELLNERLARFAYVGGDDYSIVDMAVFPWIRIHKRHGIDLPLLPHLADWFERIGERPAVKRMIERLSTIKSSRETASADDRDRLFGRGRYARL